MPDIHKKKWDRLENWELDAWQTLFKTSVRFARFKLPDEPFHAVELVSESAYQCLVEKVLEQKILYDYSPEALLIGIIHVKRKEYLRKKHNTQDLPIELPTYDPYEDADNEHIRLQLEDYASSCFQQLQEECRQLLDLAIYQEKLHSEIASIMGLSDKYVRVKKFRCLEYLKKCLSQIPQPS